jgi:tetratricopeptide (TPR) repeat protein
MKTRRQSITSSTKWHRAAFLCAVAALAATSRADTIAFKSTSDSATAKPTIFTDAKVTFVENGQITFTTSFGTTATKSLSDVVKLTLDDEPNFNAAEQDYAAGNYDRAVDEFDQTIQKTDKTWLQAYCWPSMTDAANRAGRFDKAVQGYVWLLQNNSPDAAKQVPTVPAAGSSTLDAAATTLQAAADSPSLSPAQQIPLLTLLLNTERARGETKAVEEIAGRLGGMVTNPNDPNAHLIAAALAEAKIAEANDDISKGDFAGAAATINGSKGAFTDQNLQASALYILAQVADAHAKDANDANAWRDAAIAYLRVAADFKDVSGAPHVAQSLLRAGEIVDQKLNEPDKALRMFQSIAARYPGSAPASTAAEEANRLQTAGVK